MIGTILKSRYKIIQQLGSGGFGETFIAEDLDLPSDPKPRCVVKRLQPAVIEPEVSRLFEQEAKILYNLGENHPQIPNLRAYFQEQNQFYLIQELIIGRDLSQEITQGKKLSESYVIQLLKDILPVLDFVHQNNVIHRDIKPHNIIRKSPLTPLSKGGNPLTPPFQRGAGGDLVLIDFGAVKQVKQKTIQAGTTSRTIAIGTAGYMPSEQALGKPKYSSDVYALGMTAIQALTGEYPSRLPEDNNGEIIWENLVNVSDKLATILNKMVRYHFPQRYANAGEVLEALNEAFSSVSTPPTTVINQPQQNPVITIPQQNPIIPQIQPSLKGYFPLQEMQNQGMVRRFGRGVINTVIPVSLDQVIVCARGGAGLFDTQTGEAIWEIDCPADCGGVSADGKILALGSNENIYLWDLTSGNFLRQLSGHKDWVRSVAISNNNRWLVCISYDTISYYNTVRLWDLSTGQEIRQFSDHTSGVNCVAISNDNQWLVSGSSDQTVRLWDLSTGQEIRQFSDYTSGVYSVAISNDNQWLVFDSGNTVRLCDLSTGKEIRQFSGNTDDVASVAISNDNQWLVSGSSYYYTMILRDLSTGEYITEFSGHTDYVKSVAISNDDQWLVSGSLDQTVRLWDLSTGQEIRQFSGYTDDVTSVAISNDNQWLVSGSRDQIVRLWDLSTGQEIRQFSGYTGGVSSLAISNDNRWLVSASCNLDLFNSNDNIVGLWDLSTGQEIRQFSGHTDYVKSIAISNDNQWLVSGSGDQTVRLWDLSTGQEIRLFSGHTEIVNSVAISNDNQWLVSGSGDQTVRLWDVSTGQEIRQFFGHTDWVNCVAISNDNQWIVSGGGDGVVRLWRV